MTRLFIDNLGWYHVPVNVQSLKHSIQSIFIRKYEGTLLVSMEHDPQTSQCKYSTLSDILIPSQSCGCMQCTHSVLDL
jgi:hypothetical protein